jgi:hypothetical protein
LRTLVGYIFDAVIELWCVFCVGKGSASQLHSHERCNRQSGLHRGWSFLGRSTRSIAKEVGVQPRIVSLWRHRYADHGLVLDARSVVRAPAGKSHAEAATLPMNGLTARRSLDLLGLKPG